MLKSLLNHAAEQILQDAVHAELHASHLYKHLSNQCQRLGLFGAAKYFANESAEELTHYAKIAQYFNDRGGVATIPALEAIEESVADLEAALLAAYEAEVELGQNYANWYKASLSNDPTTAQFLLQFLEIQRSSIGEYGDWLSRLALAGGDKAAILMIDSELGEG